MTHLSRRQFLASSAATSLAAGCASLPPDTPDAPNIIVILADDLGWSDIGSYGGEIATPHLDRLARGGLRFSRAYNTSKCYTTRAALLTGVYQHEAGIGGVISRVDRPLTTGPYQGYLDPGVPTLPELLRGAGYRSYHSGKWHVGEREQHWPLKRGFDRSFGLISGATSYYEVLQDEGRQRVMTRDDRVWQPPAEGLYATDAYSDEAVRYIEDHARDKRDAPFFLYLAYTAPHWPLHAPEARIAPYLDLYRQGWDIIHAARLKALEAEGLHRSQSDHALRPFDLPAWKDVEDKDVWARRMATYAAMISIMDDGIGRIVSVLEREGALDNTLILFLSDNGASHEDISARGLDQPGSVIGDRRSYQNIRAPWAWAANAPLRGTKESVFEGGIRTPLIAHWPKGIRTRGGLTDAVVHVVDFVPTALAACGLKPSVRDPSAPALRGANLMPIFAGRSPERGPLFFEIFQNEALIDRNWKITRHKGETAWSLYEITTDPAEQFDLAGEFPERVERMRRQWLSTAREIGVRGYEA